MIIVWNNMGYIVTLKVLYKDRKQLFKKLTFLIKLCQYFLISSMAWYLFMTCHFSVSFIYIKMQVVLLSYDSGQYLNIFWVATRMRSLSMQKVPAGVNLANSASPFCLIYYYWRVQQFFSICNDMFTRQWTMFLFLHTHGNAVNFQFQFQ